MVFDKHWERFLWLVAIAGVVTTLTLTFGPTRSDADTQTYNLCLEQKGVPELDGWTGATVGCRWKGGR